MSFTLPELPYEPQSLEPWLSKESFDYHHGKHHATYINKLNQAIANTELDNQPLEEIIAKTRNQNQSIFNNAAQHYNHQQFWSSLSPNKQQPNANLITLIERDFGSYEMFEKKYSEAAVGLFGSGWVWLIQTSDGQLEIHQYQNAETPGGTDNRGLLPLDVWEHAYYIDHRNDRAKFITDFWSHIDWLEISTRLI